MVFPYLPHELVLLSIHVLSASWSHGASPEWWSHHCSPPSRRGGFNIRSYSWGCYLSETNDSSTSSPWRISARCMVPPRSSARRSCHSPARNATQTDPISLPTTPLQLLMTQYLLIYRALLMARTPIHPNFPENIPAKPNLKKSRITPTLSSHRPIQLRPSRDWTHLEVQTAIPAQAVVWHCQKM